MTSTLSVLLTVTQEACDLTDVVLWPQLLELLTLGSPGPGTGRPASSLGLLTPGPGSFSSQLKSPSVPASLVLGTLGLVHLWVL